MRLKTLSLVISAGNYRAGHFILLVELAIGLALPLFSVYLMPEAKTLVRPLPDLESLFPTEREQLLSPRK